MADPIITLTTDFGAESPYAAAMKGVILGLNPSARIVDLSHHIPPQDVRHAAFLLAAAVPCFPRGVIHVVVVDPGVGSERAVLYVEVGGHRLLAPDNGCWTLLACNGDQPPVVRRLAEPRFWRKQVSNTFHGRDILAPVAAHLSLGARPQDLGPVTTEWISLNLPAPRQEADQLVGEVVFIDHFGNLITNIPGDLTGARFAAFSIGGTDVSQFVQTYAEARPGTLVALISSSDLLEIAVNQGNAAQRLAAAVGTPVRVLLRS